MNSVYLDNSSMELYHGRLDKRPNALAIRIRSLFLSELLGHLLRPCLSHHKDQWWPCVAELLSCLKMPTPWQ